MVNRVTRKRLERQGEEEMLARKRKELEDDGKRVDRLVLCAIIIAVGFVAGITYLYWVGP